MNKLIFGTSLLSTDGTFYTSLDVDANANFPHSVSRESPQKTEKDAKPRILVETHAQSYPGILPHRAQGEVSRINTLYPF